MALSFINLTRSFDERHNYIRFWGCDGAIEVACYLEVSALKTINPDIRQTEAEILKEFDKSILRIHEVTRRVYSRNRIGSYACTVTAHNF